MTAGKLLNEAISSLRENGIDEPEANAQWLLSAVLKKNRAQIILNPETEVSPSQEIMFGEYIRQKKQGIPLAYILGTQDFIDITLKVDSRVLVPRPETEELAEYAAEFRGPAPQMCSGSAGRLPPSEITCPAGMIPAKTASVKDTTY